MLLSCCRNKYQLDYSYLEQQFLCVILIKYKPKTCTWSDICMFTPYNYCRTHSKYISLILCLCSNAEISTNPIWPPLLFRVAQTSKTPESPKN